MAVVYLRNPIVAVVGAGLHQSFYFFNGPRSNPQPLDLTGMTANGKLSLANTATPAPIPLSTAHGTLQISGNQLVLHLDAADSAAWVAGAYDLQIEVVDPGLDYVPYTILSDPASSRVQIVASL